MVTTPNMGLSKWDLGSDPYSHNQLAANFQAIDIHNHTVGHGVQIPTGGIADSAITSAKLANNSVTTGKIQDGTILIADFDPSVIANLSPLRHVVMWWRENSGIAVPSGWAICDGTAWASIPNDLGLNTGNIPNLINTFPLGADINGILGPAIASTGGSHIKNLQHTHPVNPHQHNVAGHSHTVNGHSHTVNSHAHNVGSHAHSIGTDGSHHHTFGPAFAEVNLFKQRSIQQGSSTSVATAYVPGTPDGDISMSNNGDHNHGGQTGSNGTTTDFNAPGTDSQSPGTSSIGLTTDADSGTTTGNPAVSLASVDIRPQWTGLLFIMKVKNS